MKKALVLSLLLVVILLAGTTNAIASSNDIDVYINYEKVSLEEQKPFIDDNNRVQIPLRLIGEELGANFEWNGNNNTIKIEKNGTEISLEIGNKYYEINGEKSDDYKMDTTPEITDTGRTVIPLRFVSEALGAYVKWNDESKTVYINDDENFKAPDKVVEEYWKLLFVDGEVDKAEKLIKEGREEELEYIYAGIEDLEDLHETKNKYDLEIFEYKKSNDTAIVDVKITKPDFQKVLDRLSEEGIPKIVEMSSEDKDMTVMIESVNELLTEYIKETDTITHEGEVELRLVNGEWKIYDMMGDIKERFEEIEQEIVDLIKDLQEEIEQDKPWWRRIFGG
ncbi:copper amine oxidase N-terminal domain-containing protein [Natranaerofaba carboxydovora]|uniref:copper amine oxidase N-terminal domain-containing protein n=1 Tax=Natranaerofaba carboxydovora TaxID=2742683 RepID=UPI001F12A0E2|nr:copper amine oxidase N-terminal domain-containing protein [Natranaerofaba carboxydovora]UMZ73623.1 hypothetical protein ACONDI_01186 [Natranaerofaba carboxydovora]